MRDRGRAEANAFVDRRAREPRKQTKKKTERVHALTIPHAVLFFFFVLTHRGALSCAYTHEKEQDTTRERRKTGQGHRRRVKKAKEGERGRGVAHTEWAITMRAWVCVSVSTWFLRLVRVLRRW